MFLQRKAALRGSDDLHRVTVDLGERGTQGFVAGGDAIWRPAQGGASARPPPSPSAGDGKTVARPLELSQKPESLLRKRDFERTVTIDCDDGWDLDLRGLLDGERQIGQHRMREEVYYWDLQVQYLPNPREELNRQQG